MTRRIGRSIAAILAGFLAVFILSLGTGRLEELMGAMIRA